MQLWISSFGQFQPSKCVKMPHFALLQSPKSISRKIWSLQLCITCPKNLVKSTPHNSKPSKITHFTVNSLSHLRNNHSFTLQDSKNFQTFPSKYQQNQNSSHLCWHFCYLKKKKKKKKRVHTFIFWAFYQHFSHKLPNPSRKCHNKHIPKLNKTPV